MLEREGIGMVRAHGVYHTHHPVPGNDAGLFLDAVFIAPVEDEIIVLRAPAHLNHLCRNNHKARLLPEAGAQAVRVRPPQGLAGFREFLEERGVFQRKLPVGFGQAEKTLHPLGASPHRSHEAMGAPGQPDALQLGIMGEQLQRRNLQGDEDCEADKTGKYLPGAHGSTA